MKFQPPDYLNFRVTKRRTPILIQRKIGAALVELLDVKPLRSSLLNHVTLSKVLKGVTRLRNPSKIILIFFQMNISS